MLTTTACSTPKNSGDGRPSRFAGSRNRRRYCVRIATATIAGFAVASSIRAYLALDYHVQQGRGDQPALIYDSPVTGDASTRYTYEQLCDEVARFAGALWQLGVEKGDTVVIYMPMIPETIVAMLACAYWGDSLGGLRRICRA